MMQGLLRRARRTAFVLVGKTTIETAVAEMGAGAVKILRLSSKPRASVTPFQAVAESGVRVDEAVLLIGREYVTIRTLDLPTTDAQEIRDIVSIQAAKQTPFTREQIYHDHAVLNLSPQGYTKILLAIAQRDKIEECCRDFEGKGICLSGVRLDSEGLAAWADARGSAAEAQAVIAQGLNGSEFAAVHSGRLVYSKLLHVPDGRPGGPGWSERLAEEVGLAVDAYQADGCGPALTRAVVLGSDAFREQAVAALTGKFGLRSSAPDGWPHGIRAEGEAGFARTEDGGYAYAKLIGAVSLSARGNSPLDLAPPHLKIAAANRRSRGLLGRALSLACLLLVALSLLKLEHLAGDLWRLKQLDARAAALSSQTAALEDVDRRLTLLRVSGLAAASPLTLLRETASAAPSGISLTGFDCRPGEQLLIQGTAGSEGDVADFRGRLAASVFVSSAQTRFVAPRQSGSGTASDFEIQCALKPLAQFQPYPQPVDAAQDASGGISERLTRTSRRIRYLESLLERRDALGQEALKYERFLSARPFTDQAEWAALLKEAEGVAKEQQLTLLDARMAGVVSAGSGREYRLHVDAQGPMLAALRVCRLLETSRQWIRVNRLALALPPNQRGAVRAAFEVAKLSL